MSMNSPSRWPFLSRIAESLGLNNRANQSMQDKDITRVNSVLLPVLVVGLLAILCRGWLVGATCSILLWALASLSAGGFTGFLFGIPKSNSITTKPNSLQASTAPIGGQDSGNTHNDSRPNTNLEEISDWITKIIVGLTLVNLSNIQKEVQSISSNAAASFSANPTDGDASFATALLVSFSILGFFAGYLYTRLFLQGAFARSDADLKKDWLNIVNQETRKGLNEPSDDSGRSALPTVDQIQSAERVRQAAPAGSPDIVLSPIKALGAEYESLRQTMPPGRERTRAMTEIVKRMSPLALTAAPFLQQLSRSESAGDRLAAIIVLKFKFDFAYLDWLVARLKTETAFMAFHAAGALLAGARLLGPDQKNLLKDAVREAQIELRNMGLNDEAVQSLLTQILNT
ncbi:hypothetical protein [Variovorax sp. dw_954]|uniref:hypothetical protein n=1 Tax=Variovorax sp. dw_954 TaxID=2720078 RepID=UPI001BD485D3|nr:hypothetical protein [Variovorax sp. dw_954]